MSLLFCALLLSVALAVVPNDYCQHDTPSTRLSPHYPVKHLTLIFRHGDRSPIHPCWPGSPSWHCTLEVEERPSHHISSRLYIRNYMEGRNLSPGNCGAGALTDKGYQQHLINGMAIRNLYIPLGDLPQQYNATLIYTRSTDKPRTYVSVEALLFGLYPVDPDSNGKCFSELHINSIDKETDNMVPNEDTCHVLKKIKKDMEKSTTYQNYIKQVRTPLVRDATAAFGLPESFSWRGMFDCMQANLCHNKTVPSGLTQSLYNRIITDHFVTNKMIYNWIDKDSGYTYAQIALGSFVGDFLARMDFAAQNKTAERLAIYSGHDNTLEPLTMAFGVNNGDSPPYAALMRIELLDSGKQGSLVRAYYDNQALLFPGCPSTTCPYDIFKQVSQKLIAAGQECQKPDGVLKQKRRLDRRS